MKRILFAAAAVLLGVNVSYAEESVLENNDELNMVVTDPGLAKDVETRLFDADLPKCERVLHYSPNISDHAASQADGLL